MLYKSFIYSISTKHISLILQNTDEIVAKETPTLTSLTFAEQYPQHNMIIFPEH